MDPVAHGFSGAALAAAGLRRATPLGTAALVLGAVLPDLDALMMFAGPFAALAHRRGWTHGALALVVLPLLVTGCLMLWDRRVRRRSGEGAARARTLFLLSALGVLAHLAFDWVNNYGVRLLMPFDGRWFYGDALFIIDPWVWALLGGATFLTWSRRPASWILAGLFAAVLSIPVFQSELVGPLARGTWSAALVLVMLLRVGIGRRSVGAASAETLSRAALGAVGLYVAASLALNVPIEAQVRATLAERGIGDVRDIMIAPVPADPSRRFVVIDAGEGYLTGTWNASDTPRLQLAEGRIAKNLDQPLVRAAAQEPDARNFLVWARYPYAVVEPSIHGQVVRFEDARYVGGGIRGPRVHMPAER